MFIGIRVYFIRVAIISLITSKKVKIRKKKAKLSLFSADTVYLEDLRGFSFAQKGIY